MTHIDAESYFHADKLPVEERDAMRISGNSDTFHSLHFIKCQMFFGSNNFLICFGLTDENKSDSAISVKLLLRDMSSALFLQFIPKTAQLENVIPWKLWVSERMFLVSQWLGTKPYVF